ncbi:hypothetical protein PISMIDRAFT_105397, partial [Pisolithus microcarpus 441]
VYPCLSQMAVDFLTIPATSVDVEHLFSHGCILLSHTQSHLSAQSVWALLCLSSWSVDGFIKSADIHKLTTLDEIEGDSDIELMPGWDAITIQ